MMDELFFDDFGRSKAANRVDQMGFRQIAFDRLLSITFWLFGVYRLESHPEHFFIQIYRLTTRPRCLLSTKSFLNSPSRSFEVMACRDKDLYKINGYVRAG